MHDNPYLNFLSNLPPQDEEETQGILSGLKSWLGFAGTLLGTEGGVMSTLAKDKSWGNCSQSE